MSFAGKVWRLLVGVKDALALLFLLLFFSLLFAALSARPSPAQVRDGALLLRLEGSITEEPAVVDPVEALLTGTLPTREYSARELARAIDRATADERIKAIALDLTTFTGGPAVSVREVAEALGRFRAADKPVVAYGVAYSDDAMMLAAQASEVWVDPLGGVAVRGPGGSILFYGAALERYGINAHVYQVGTYKGTGEPYSSAQMSPELRENLETYTAQLWEEYSAQVRQARPSANLAAATTGLLPLVEASGGNLAQVALEAGLADTIGTHDEWGARLAELAGEDKWDDRPGAFAATDLDTYIAATAGDDEDDGMFSTIGGGDKAIGIITIAGEITDGEAGPGSAGAARITRLLEDALDDDLAALVVRIDSPGGTVTGSESIRRAIMRFRDRDIPVVVSMGNYAASGGYWIATAGQRIFAEPETLTGSIGVILVVPSFEEILAEYGINSESIRTTPLSGQPDLLGGFTPETEALLQAETQAIYDRFVGLVAEARGIDRARADELSQGRVWTGGSARQLGLVDQFGGLDAAIAYAAEQAGLDEGQWNERFLTSPPDPFDAMLAGLVGGTGAESRPQALVSIASLFAAQEQQVAARVVADFERLMGSTGAQALCLECAPELAAPSPWQASAGRPWYGVLASRLFAN